MATGRSNQTIKQVGEYLVACELARREFLVATFAGNVPDFDIIVTDYMGASCPIQVKASRSGSWQFTITKFADITFNDKKQIIGNKIPNTVPNLICVFVVTADIYGDDRFYILEWSTAQDIIINNHANWLEIHGGVRPKKFDSMHCAIGEQHLLPFKDNWSLITKVQKLYTE